MSLYKAKEWWSTQCGSGEEFDGGCMVIDNIDNDPTGAVKIVTGSFQGFLRIYQPRQREYRPEDLLLEVELEFAILQLASGRFSGNGGIQLAILHPRKLTVYSVQSSAADQQGTSLQLSRLYEHHLEHTAANMCHGPFGGVSETDNLCVQSYDGQLSFLEHEVHAFSRHLPNFLVPGPLAYAEVTDSFITCNAAFELESYKYKVLAAAATEKVSYAGTDMSSGGGLNSVKKLHEEWRLVLGEAAVNIRVGRVTSGLTAFQADIIVLCEHHVFVINTSGSLVTARRLEYHPACFTTYPAPSAKQHFSVNSPNGNTGSNGPENLIIATHSRAMLIYRGSSVCWAARLERQPVTLVVADVAGVKGMITIMDDQGYVAVTYLGTDPALHVLGASAEGRELDYEAMAKEHRSLARTIREYAGSGGARVEPNEVLVMRPQIPQHCDGDRKDREDLKLGAGYNKAERQVTVKLYLHMSGGLGSGATDVTLLVQPPDRLTVDAGQECICVPFVTSDESDPTVVLITFHADSSYPPTSTRATVTATYASASGEPRALSLQLQLPLCIFATVIPPIKNADFKLTVTTNRAPPQLTQLFPDLLSSLPQGVLASLTSGAAGANVLTLQLMSGTDVTILVSKTGGRYRLQSDSFESIWLPMEELCRRLVSYYALTESNPEPGAQPLSITFEEALPLDDYWQLVENHWEARRRLAVLKLELEERATQFRAIEKRLLMRFKDKNPSPLNQLDVLMEETFQEMARLAQAATAASGLVETTSHKLAGATHLVLQLIRYRFGLSEADEAVLRAYLSPIVLENSDVGWEEMTEASMTQLLRSVLARNAKEASVALPPLTTAKDTARLKKHTALVLERLSRGVKLAESSGGLNATSSLPATLGKSSSMSQAAAAAALNRSMSAVKEAA